jgi:hypothetical protein
VGIGRGRVGEYSDHILCLQRIDILLRADGKKKTIPPASASLDVNELDQVQPVVLKKRPAPRPAAQPQGEACEKAGPSKLLDAGKGQGSGSVGEGANEKRKEKRKGKDGGLVIGVEVSTSSVVKRKRGEEGHVGARVDKRQKPLSVIEELAGEKQRDVDKRGGRTGDAGEEPPSPAKTRFRKAKEGRSLRSRVVL